MADHPLRIHQASPSVQRQAANEGGIRFGKLDGSQLAIRAAQADIDEKIQLEQLKRARGLDVPFEQKSLQTRQISARDRPATQNLEQARRFEQSFGASQKSPARSQLILQQLLAGSRLPNVGNSPAEIAEQFTALLRLDAALRGDDENFVAKLSLFRPDTPDIKTLAKQLQAAGDDAHQMQQLLADVRGLPEDQQELAKLLNTARFKPDELKQILRKSQQLPHLSAEDKHTLAERIQDELAELLQVSGSHVRAMDALLAKAGEEGTRSLAETYDEFIHSNSSTLAGLLGTLVARHPPAELSTSILPLVEKTIAHELGLGEAMRSFDAVKTPALLNFLRGIRIIKTEIERINGFVTTMRRLFSGKINEQRFNEQQMMTSLLKAIDSNWISSIDVERTIRDFGIADGPPKIFFLTGLMQKLREFDFAIFSSPTTRSALLDSIQEVLDRAIEQEASAAELEQTPTN